MYIYHGGGEGGERKAGDAAGLPPRPPLRSVTVWRYECVHGGRLSTTTAAVVIVVVVVASTVVSVTVGGSPVSDRAGCRTDVAGHDDGHGQRRSERAVRRSRRPGGRRCDRRQRAGDRGLSTGTTTPPAHQLLHRVASGRRLVGRSGGHTVRRLVQRRSAPSPAPVHFLGVADNRPVHRVHTQPGGRIRRPVLGHTLPDGLLYELQHQNRNQ